MRLLLILDKLSIINIIGKQLHLVEVLLTILNVLLGTTFLLLVFSFVAGRHLYYKRQALALRLARGRGKLLTETIALRQRDLDNFDLSHLKALGQQANKVLESLGTTLAHRRSHLQNCEDLAHLQEYKLQLLATLPTGESESREQPDANVSLGRRREFLEQDLLANIADRRPPRDKSR